MHEKEHRGNFLRCLLFEPLAACQQGDTFIVVRLPSFHTWKSGPSVRIGVPIVMLLFTGGEFIGIRKEKSK